VADGGGSIGAPRLGGVRVGVQRPTAPLPPTHSLGRVRLGRRSRDAADLAEIDRRLGAALTRRFGERPAPRQHDTAELARLLSRHLKFELTIRGQHYSGLSNQKLLEIRKREGRDFAKDTLALREHVRRVLVAQFRPGQWDDDTATTLAAEAIRDWIVARINGDVTDVPLDALSPAYAERKRRAGKGGESIGVWSGRWRDAVAERGDVTIT
jgi:hypothetical protein